MLFESWRDLGRIAVVGVLAYTSLVAILRISGNRSLSKLNAFDFVVTVALGSTLASILTSKDLSLASGVGALALLVLLQYLVTSTALRWAPFDELVKSEPVVVLFRGAFVADAMRKSRVSEEEVRSALRKHGVFEVRESHAVVLEANGTLSVLEQGELPSSGRSSLDGIRLPEGPDG